MNHPLESNDYNRTAVATLIEKSLEYSQNEMRRSGSSRYIHRISVTGLTG